MIFGLRFSKLSLLGTTKAGTAQCEHDWIIFEGGRLLATSESCALKYVFQSKSCLGHPRHIHSKFQCLVARRRMGVIQNSFIFN